MPHGRRVGKPRAQEIAAVANLGEVSKRISRILAQPPAAVLSHPADPPHLRAVTGITQTRQIARPPEESANHAWLVQ
jgi:hypothetical protein